MNDLWQEVINAANKKMVLEQNHWESIKNIENPDCETQYVAILESRGEALKYIKSPYAQVLIHCFQNYPRTLDYLTDERILENEEMLISVVMIHYKNSPEIIENLEVFKDKSLFAYIKLAAGV